MRNFYLLLLSIFVFSCAPSIKLNTPNTSTAGDLVVKLNDMLLNQYSDDVFNISGIFAISFYNSVVIMHCTEHKDYRDSPIGLEELYKKIFEVVKNEKINTNEIRYIITATLNQLDYILPFGSAILMDGSAYSKYVNEDNFDSLLQNATFLESNYHYVNDPDVYTILEGVAFRLNWLWKYGVSKYGGRIGTYNHINEASYK